jgi:hypothetical protein
MGANGEETPIGFAYRRISEKVVTGGFLLLQIKCAALELDIGVGGMKVEGL